MTTRQYDGWLLRFADGYTRRSNSVNPAYGSTLDVRRKVAQCEAIYTDWNVPICFRLTDAPHPSDLGALLTDSGYRIETPTSVQVIDLATIDGEDDPDLFSTPQLTDDWLADFTRMDLTAPHKISPMRQVMSLIQPQTCYMSLLQDGYTVAVGLAVRDGDYVGLYQVVTDEAYRRRGFGRAVVFGLLRWGKANGATIGHLSVVPDNIPAHTLYGKIGFREVYQYRYYVR